MKEEAKADIPIIDSRLTNQKITVYYALVALMGILVIFLVEYFGFLEGINNYAYDLSFRLRGSRRPSDKIIIIAIDEKTLDRLGKWPIRRAYYAGLLDAVSQSRVVLFGVVMAEPSPDDPVLTDAIDRYSKAILPVYIDGQSKQVIYPQPFPARGIGHVHLEEEIDGVIRKAYHTLSFEGMVLPSISSVGWEIYTGKTFIRKDTSPALEEAASSEMIIQMDPLKINYHGGPGTFHSISLADIIDGKYAPEYFKDSVVLVGVTAAGIEASLLTPFSEKRSRMSGVEIHANLISNILDKNYIRDVDGWIQSLLCVVFAGFFFFFLLKLGEQRAALFWLLSLALVTLSVFFLFTVFNRWVNPAVYYFSFTFVFLTTYTLRLDEAARRLDSGYTDIVSIPGLKVDAAEQTPSGKGLFSLFSPADINSKIRLVTEITGKLKDAYVQISKDLEAAAQIQRDLLPASALAIPGVKFEWFFYPSSFVAGDIFNYFLMDDSRIGFYVADVSGHGVPAAMLAVTISKVLTPLQPTENSLVFSLPDSPEQEAASPATVVKEANRFFSSTARSDQYFTAVYGIIDTAQRKITLAQAGLPQPVLLREDGDVSAVGQGGFPIGLMDGIDYTDEVIAYNPGDRIFLYSDGIIECFNKKSEQFSIDRLMTVLQEGRHASLKVSLDTLEQSLFDWRG